MGTWYTCINFIIARLLAKILPTSNEPQYLYGCQAKCYIATIGDTATSQGNLSQCYGALVANGQCDASLWSISVSASSAQGQACSNSRDDWDDRAKSYHKLTHHSSRCGDGYLLPGRKT